MKKPMAWWQQVWVRFVVGLVVLLVAGSIFGAVLLTQAAPEQPIQFPHRTHIALGAQCLYCHPAAAWGPVASLPSPEKCWGCHQQVQKKSPELDKLAAYVKAGQSIPWVPVAIQPDFVHFNHRPHVARGIECKTCHGDLAKMTVAEPQPRQNMGWCLDCHKRMEPSQFARLSDCSTCHY
ncbi:MAG TPA: cytochrome c3 family protein [Anaerolineaceae bacterium]